MKRASRTLLTIGLVAAILLVAQPASAGCRWSRVDVPVPDDGWIAVLEVLSTDDVWGVGARYSGGVAAPLARHWNGETWERTPVPNFGERGARLVAIDAVTSDDVWAVGTYTRTNTSKGFLVHWDGSGWSVVPTPHVQGRTMFQDVSAAAADDAWIVGSRIFDRKVYPLSLHWDGTAWSHAPASSEAGPSFEKVAITSSSEVWALGPSTPRLWNGSSWEPVAAFPPFYGTAISEHGWIAGHNPNERLAVARLVGDTWETVPTDPTVRRESNTWVNDVDGSSPRRMWLGGYYSIDRRGYPMLERWTGEEWKFVDVPAGNSVLDVDHANGVTWVSVELPEDGMYRVLKRRCS